MTPSNQPAITLASALAESGELYNDAPCGFHSIDSAGVFLYANATLLRWLGCTREELIGKRRITEFLSEAGKEEFRNNFPRLANEGRLDALAIELIGAQGQTRHVSVTANAVRDAQGQFLMTRTVLFDISELHQSRERLRQIAHEQDAMLNNDLIGIVKLKDRQAVWLNSAMYRIFGYGPGEMQGLPSSILYPSEQAFADFGAAAYSALSSGQIYRAQVQMVRKDGTLLWIDANGFLLSAQTQEFMWMLADITPIKQAQAHVEHLAFHDALTGLPNRLLLSDRLEQSLGLAARQKQMLALCYLDLDGFKPVNDQHGHEAGDRLLQEVARRLRLAVRTSDTVCRLGGDEFVLLLPGLTQREECARVVQRAAIAIAQPFDLGEGHVASVTASIGVALFPADAQDADNLLRHADRAMYRAKQQGPGHTRWHGDSSSS
jgi:diguanylate cyclase (GGDEF)-like protein/PAS domain S-box-containing protein